MKIVEFKDYDNQTTPLSAYNLNRLQQNLITTKYQMTFSSEVSGGSTITLPCYYQVGQDTLDVYLNSELLKKASTKDSEGHYYEVGNSDTKSNQIKITSDWSIASGDVLNLIVRGTTDSYDQNLSPDKATQLADEISANKEEITALQTENSRLKGITNALPKISGEDTSLTLTNTANAPLSDIILKGNTSQEGTPTPDAPINVDVVSGSNVISTSNKNLFNAQIQAGTYKEATYSVARDGLITQSATDGSPFSTTQTRNFYLDAGTYTINCIGKGTEKRLQIRNVTDNVNIIETRSEKETFTLTERKLLAIKTWGNSTYPVSYYVQIEKGSEATTYEPHQGKELPLDLGNIELCKIGDYQDYFYKNNNKWYKREVIGSVTLDGSEKWYLAERTDTNNGVIYIDYSTIGRSDFSNKGAYSNYAKFTTSFSSKVGQFDTHYSQWRFYAPTNTITVNEWKTMLKTTNLELKYIKSESSDIEITDTTLITQLNALYNAYTYNDTTNITQTNANLPFIINAEAFKKIS